MCEYTCTKYDVILYLIDSRIKPACIKIKPFYSFYMTMRMTMTNTNTNTHTKMKGTPKKEDEEKNTQVKGTWVKAKSRANGRAGVTVLVVPHHPFTLYIVQTTHWSFDVYIWHVKFVKIQVRPLHAFTFRTIKTSINFISIFLSVYLHNS